MLNRTRRSKSAAATAPGGVLAVSLPPNMRSILDQLGQRWRCGTDRAAERIIVLALTGWRPKYADILERLSLFVPGQENPLPRTCLMLRHHFDAAEVQLGEPVKECDREAWLETLLETLHERRKDGQPARLSDLLADAARDVGG